MSHHHLQESRKAEVATRCSQEQHSLRESRSESTERNHQRDVSRESPSEPAAHDSRGNGRQVLCHRERTVRSFWGYKLPVINPTIDDQFRIIQ